MDEDAKKIPRQCLSEYEMQLYEQSYSNFYRININLRSMLADYQL